MTQEIKTERLVLRALRAQDAATVADDLAGLDVTRWLTRVPHPYSKNDAVEFINRTDGTFPRLAAITHNNTLIGTVDTREHLGYWLAPHAWGKGFATEAARAAVAHYFGATDTETLASGYLQGNAASCNVLTKLGFTQKGSRISTPVSTNVPITHYDMALTRTAWEATQ